MGLVSFGNVLTLGNIGDALWIFDVRMINYSDPDLVSLNGGISEMNDE